MGKKQEKELIDFSKLQGLIREVLGSQTVLAKKINLSTSALSKKMNNKIEFTSTEILNISRALGIPNELIHVYFFTTKVQEIEQKIATEH